MKIVKSPKARWLIAGLLNRLPGQCWTDLVTWAQGSRFQRFPWAPVTSTCRRDAAENGRCYCSKLGGPTADEKAKAS